MYGPEGALVHKWVRPVGSSSRAANPQPASHSPATIRRIPLLPLQSGASSTSYILALSVEDSAVVNDTMCVEALPIHQTFRLRAAGSPTLVATKIAGQDGPQLRNRRRQRDNGTPPQIHVLVQPEFRDQKTLVARVTRVDAVLRVERLLARDSLTAEDDVGVAATLKKFSTAHDTTALRSIEHNLSDAGTFEEEDPTLVRKAAKERQQVLRMLDAAEVVQDDRDRAEPALSSPHSAGSKPPKSVLKEDPLAKKARLDTSGSPSMSTSSASVLPQSGADGMPAPLPVAHAPPDLHEKTTAAIKRHLGATLSFDDFWKDVARCAEEFKVIKTKSKEVQLEWSRVFKSAVLRHVQQAGCTVTAGTLTIPSSAGS